MSRKFSILLALIAALSLLVPFNVFGSSHALAAPPANPVTFTILQTNDFHGQLEAANSDPNKISTPGMARTARVINAIRTSKGPDNVLLVDAGDEMQGSLLSNLGDGTQGGQGAPTIATFNQMGYNVATFGNHEFDWGQTVLSNRTTQATYPFVTANIVKNDTSNCATAGWTKPDFAAAPYIIKTMGTSPNQVKVAFIGVTTQETPTITIASATAGLCFKDPTASIEHYYSQMISDGANVIVVLSHLGYADGGYGYGIPVYGDQTLAKNLITDGDPVNLIIGGHSHTSVNAPGTTVTVNGKTGSTLVTQAAYNGRRVGQSDITVGTDGSVSISWKVTVWTQQNTTVVPSIPVSEWRTFTTASAFTEDTDVSQDVGVAAVISQYAQDPGYLTLVNTPIGYSAVDLGRNGGTVDNMMGTFIDDAIYSYLNTDSNPVNDIDVFFNNAGGIRTDWCFVGDAWQSSSCTTSGLHVPGLLTYGNMFTVLPFGNATVVGTMTGAQILQVLDQAPLVSNGVIQPTGLKYKYYAYRDANPGPQPFAWGAFDYCIVNKTTKDCDPIDMNKTYHVGTNEFLAPGGGDGYGGFKYMQNITYWGDMLNAVDAYVSAQYGTAAMAYAGPNGDGTLDGRILRDGTDTPNSGSIIPITVLHNNDSHGNLTKGSYVGMTQLATLIKQEELHNPGCTLLLNGGDQIQGDAMMYYYKSAPEGFAADGTPLPTSLQTQPMIDVMNSLHYDAMTLGNHEFNFGSTIFDGIFKLAQFPLLGANLTDSGAYGLNTVGPNGEGVLPDITKTMTGTNCNGVKVAVLGLTNPRVPNYELPSNIVGLTFSSPIDTAIADVPALRASNDVVIALTHIGFTSDPNSVSYDPWVDTNLAAQVKGIDAIIGAHSHTNPASPDAPYKFLPTILGNPDGDPVLVTQAYRYNNTLGEVVIGVRAKAGGGYEVVSQAGQYLTVTMSTPEDPATKAIIDPFVTQLNTYYNQTVGKTTVPIDTTKAFTEETNGANLQAEASIWELNKHGITPDFHLSGAMTNNLMASGATPTNPFTLKISDMFNGMPYENSLVTLRMNGPQLKAVLERAYRNYYYYKYVPGRGGYSWYTTCMIDINSVGRIYYRDANPTLPDGNNVVALIVKGKPIDFTDASTYYIVSTVNYLAAGSCNFNDNGVSLWPLNQIVNDTQYYVRDAVIDYIHAMGTVSPAIEGRLLFGDTTPPVVTITAPTAQTYLHSALLTLHFSAVDGPDGTTPSLAPPSGVKSIVANLDGTAVVDGQVVDLMTLSIGTHTLTVTATDYYNNVTTQSVTFGVTITMQSLTNTVNRFFNEGKIDNAGILNSFLAKLSAAQAAFARGQTKTAINNLNAFISEVQAQSGKHITKVAADMLIADAMWLIAHPNMALVSNSVLLQSLIYSGGFNTIYLPNVRR